MSTGVIMDVVFGVLDVVFGKVLKTVLSWADLEVWMVSEPVHTTNTSGYQVFTTIEEKDKTIGWWDWTSRRLKLQLQMGYNVLFVTLKSEVGVPSVGYVRHQIELREKNNWGEPTGKYFRNSFRIETSGVKYFRKNYRLTKGYMNMVSHQFETGDYEFRNTNWTWIRLGQFDSMLKICTHILEHYNVTFPSTTVLHSDLQDADPPRLNMMAAINNNIYFRRGDSILYETTVKELDTRVYSQISIDFTDACTMVGYNDDLYYVRGTWLYRHDANTEPLEVGKYVDNAMRSENTHQLVFQMDNATFMCGIPGRGKILIGMPNNNTQEYDIATHARIPLFTSIPGAAFIAKKGDTPERVFHIDDAGNMCYYQYDNQTIYPRRELGSWTGTKLMTAYKEQVYMVKGDELIRFNPDNFTTKVLATGFSDVIAMVPIDDTICIRRQASIEAILPHVLE